jgi:hypothetical protein
MRVASGILLVIAANAAACQMRNLGLLSAPSAQISVAEVRRGMEMDSYDSVLNTHRIVVSGEFRGPNGHGTFKRVYEPDGHFAHHSQPAGLEESVERFDGKALWVESTIGHSYPMTLSRTQLACSVEWILSGRWLAPEDSPFHATPRNSTGVYDTPGFALQLKRGGPEATISLDTLGVHPRSLTIQGRSGPLVIGMRDWRTRRGFAWPHIIQIQGEDGDKTTLTTTDVFFEPSAATLHASEISNAQLEGVSFVAEGPKSVRLSRSASGHMLVRPKLIGQDVGWFLIDTGTGVNCLDLRTIEAVPDFLSKDLEEGRPISVVGLGGTVDSRVHKGREFSLGSMRAKHMEWVSLDLTGLQEVVGVPLAGVLGGDFFQRAVVEIDLLDGTLVLHDSKTFDSGRLPWRPLRFDGTTPCVQASFAPSHEGWFRLDTGSDDTVTFHSPWVRKLRMVDKATNLIPMRLKGIGGELPAVRGRIRWFELMGQNFPRPNVTMVERATGPLANPDLCGNIGVGFFTGQRLILDYPSHRVALIPR